MFKLQKKESFSRINERASQLLKPNQKLLYATYFNQSIILVLEIDNQIIIRSSSMHQSSQINISKYKIYTKLQEIVAVYYQKNQAFLVIKNPFQLYYITAFSEEPIKITLTEQLQFDESAFDIIYPSLYVYGRTLKNSNVLISIHLQTLNIKILNDGTGYSPGNRVNFVSLFHEGRLYIFDGADNKGQRVAKLLWVFDLQKGYWFALQMQYPVGLANQNIAFHKLDSSKVVITSQKSCKMWVLEVNQSRLTEVIAEEAGYYSGRNITIEQDTLNFDGESNKIKIWRHKIVTVK